MAAVPLTVVRDKVAVVASVALFSTQRSEVIVLREAGGYSSFML